MEKELSKKRHHFNFIGWVYYEDEVKDAVKKLKEKKIYSPRDKKFYINVEEIDKIFGEELTK